MRLSLIILLGLIIGLTSCSRYADIATSAYSAQSFVDPALPVWIDTDPSCSGSIKSPEVDDCWALLYAFKHLKVIGLSFANGNTNAERAAQVYKRQLSSYAPSDLVLASNIQEIKNTLGGQKVTFISLGAATNFAALLNEQPGLQNTIDSHIMVMGCRLKRGCLRPRGSAYGFRDLNFVVDKLAAMSALKSGVRTILVPFETARHNPLDRTSLRELAKELDAPKDLVKLSQRWRRIWKAISLEPGFYPFDLMAVKLAHQPKDFVCLFASSFKSKKKWLDVELGQAPNKIVYCPDRLR